MNERDVLKSSSKLWFMSLCFKADLHCNHGNADPALLSSSAHSCWMTLYMNICEIHTRRLICHTSLSYTQDCRAFSSDVLLLKKPKSTADDSTLDEKDI